MATAADAPTMTRRFPGARHAGAVAGLVAGPLFLTIVAVLTLVEHATLERYGWTYTTSNDVPWPSGLALGSYGAIQVLNFAVTGLLVLLFARAFADELRGSVTGRIGIVLLGLIGVALTLAAFPTDQSSAAGHGANTWHGDIHDGAFVLLVAASVFAPLFVGLALRRNPAWRRLARVSLVVPLLLVVSFALQSALGDLAFTATLAISFGWIALLAGRLLTTEAR